MSDSPSHNTPLAEHLEDLRWHIIRSLIYLVIFTIFTYLCFSYIWDFLMSPIGETIIQAEKIGIVIKLITTELSENFLLRIKISLFTGIILAVPLILWEVLRFIIPAISKSNHKKMYLLLLFSVVLFWAGIMCARLLIWPQLNSFFIIKWAIPSFLIQDAIISTEIHLTLQKYLDLLFIFHFILGCFFQIPVISIVLAYFRIIDFSFFTKYWQYAIVISAVLGATITPPDVFSMITLMLPLILLYWIAAVLVLLVRKARK